MQIGFGLRLRRPLDANTRHFAAKAAAVRVGLALALAILTLGLTPATSAFAIDALSPPTAVANPFGIAAGFEALPPPEEGKYVNVAPASGRVFIAVGAAGRFVRLWRAEQIPVGSLVDARQGTVRLLTASDRIGVTGEARARGSIFKVLQPGGGLTELRLAGGNFGQCRPARSAEGLASRRRLSARVIRRLRMWVPSGTYASRGRKLKAIAKAPSRRAQRGYAGALEAEWVTIDHCPVGGRATLIRPKRGSDLDIFKIGGGCGDVSTVASVRRRTTRRLRGRFCGRFRTRGRYSGATVRG